MPDYASLMQAFRDETAAGPAPPLAAPGVPGSNVRRPNARLPSYAWAGLAAAAVLAAVVGSWAIWPRAADGELVEGPPVSGPLVAGPLVTGPLTADVQLAVDGAGSVTGSARALDLAWDAGTLRVEVEPGRGVQLAVRTAEATVEVVGTGFDVVRDALGTSVTVRHGLVRVGCVDGDRSELGPGATTTCRPTTAAGRLGRVRALQARSAPTADEIAVALALPDATGSVRDELRAAQLDGYVASRDPRAFALAEELASAGGPRALTAHRVAARLADGCPRALPHLAALAAADALGDDAPAWERCSKGR